MNNADILLKTVLEFSKENSNSIIRIHIYMMATALLIIGLLYFGAKKHIQQQEQIDFLIEKVDSLENGN
ncbi:MAG: hypothetical protein ACPGXZ_10670 [Saprospiraceae bacterium]